MHCWRTDCMGSFLSHSEVQFYVWCTSELAKNLSEVRCSHCKKVQKLYNVEWRALHISKLDLSSEYYIVWLRFSHVARFSGQPCSVARIHWHYVCSLTWTDVNECSSDPCQNGGTCSDRINAYICTCSPGYVGTNCSIGEHHVVIYILTGVVN